MVVSPVFARLGGSGWKPVSCSSITSSRQTPQRIRWCVNSGGGGADADAADGIGGSGGDGDGVDDALFLASLRFFFI